MKHLISLIFLLSALPLSAQHADTLRAVDHSWLFGVGRTHVLDTYLSPQDYVGAGFSVSHRTERKARWGRGRVTVVAHYRADAAHLTGQSGDGREWDANLRVGVGWMWNKRSAQRPFRLAFGPLIEAGTGITYNTRNGNNPAQGRLFMDVAAAGLAEYAFRVAASPFGDAACSVTSGAAARARAARSGSAGRSGAGSGACVIGAGVGAAGSSRRIGVTVAGSGQPASSGSGSGARAGSGAQAGSGHPVSAGSGSPWGAACAAA